MKMPGNLIERRFSLISLSGRLFFIAIVVFFGFSLLSKRFLTLTNLFSFMHASVPLIFVASGMAIVVLTRNLDISVGSVAFLAPVVGSTLLVRYSVSLPFSIVVTLCVGLLAGLCNGFVVTKLGVNSFIATLGTMMIFRGIGLQIVKGRTIGLPSSLSDLSSTRLGVFYWDVLVSLLFLLSLHVVQTRTPFGRYVAAIGSNSDVCRRAGINVERVVLFSFLLSGLFASMGGLWLSAQLGSVSLRMGIGMEFVALASIVIGGISLFGGEGSLFPGLLLGVYVLYMIESGLNYLGVSPYLYPLVRGGLIFSAMYADSLRIRLAEKRGAPSAGR
jgi:ribose/xylose/arabinose/galactoside ABC-type transport system permease subunit